MRIENYVNYGMCIYDNVLSPNDAYQLGDVVINQYNEVAVVIQVHSPVEFRGDMFGNFSDSEVRLASFDEMMQYRPNLRTEGKFRHEAITYTAVRIMESFGGKKWSTTSVFNSLGDRIAYFGWHLRQPKYGSKNLIINDWKHPITQWMKS